MAVSPERAGGVEGRGAGAEERADTEMGEESRRASGSARAASIQEVEDVEDGEARAAAHTSTDQ